MRSPQSSANQRTSESSSAHKRNFRACRSPEGRGFRVGAGRSVGRDRSRFSALHAFDDLHGDALALGEIGDAGALEDRSMDEDILAAIADGDEAEALVGIVPFDGAGHLDGVREIGRGTLRTGAERTGTAGRLGGGAALVDVENLGDLRAFLTLADARLDLGAGEHALAAGGFEHGDVQEGVARAVGELDEAEALLRIEPFDHGIDDGTGRRRPRRPAELTGHLEPRAAVARAKIVVIETAPTRFAEIL